jgi:hypothetical protein
MNLKMKKIIIILSLVISTVAANAQMLAMPKASQDKMMAAKNVLLRKTAIDPTTANRIFYAIQQIEMKQLKAQTTLADKPAELAKVLADLKAQKLNNLQGGLTKEIFSTLTKEEIELIIK